MGGGGGGWEVHQLPIFKNDRGVESVSTQKQLQLSDQSHWRRMNKKHNKLFLSKFRLFPFEDNFYSKKGSTYLSATSSHDLNREYKH